MAFNACPAADDPRAPFLRAGSFQAIAVGALEPAAAIEEFVPFVPGEAPWQLAGTEKPAALIAIEAQASPAKPARKEPGARRKRGPTRSKPQKR